MDWTLAGWILATLAVTGGGLLQAATGLGAGLIIVPLLALISYALVPGPMIFASLALSGLMAVRGRRAIEYRHTGVLLTGISVGTAIAAAYLRLLPLETLGAVFGGFVLLAVALSVRAPRFSLSGGSLLGVGAVSGIMGTSAGIGAPVLALLYQYHVGATIRATLAFLYFFSSLVMLAFLHWVGRFGPAELWSGLLLVPGFVLGYLLSPRLAHYLDRGYARPAVLLVSTASALVLIGRSLTGF